MLKASVKDFLRSYNKLRNAYINSNLDNRTRQLLLVYCVECGLKYLLMRDVYKIHITTKDDSFLSHDISVLLRKLGEYKAVGFNTFQTAYKENVGIVSFHQICRYNIAVAHDAELHCHEYEMKLKEIEEWIHECI